MSLLSLLVASLVNSRSLRDTVVVAPPDDVGTFWKLEDALNCLPRSMCKPEERVGASNGYLPYFYIAAPVVLRPYAKNILAAPHAQDKAADFFPGFNEPITNESH